MRPQLLSALFLLALLSELTMFSSGAATDQPEVRIAMIYSPETVREGDEITFTVDASDTSSGSPVTGASVIIGFEKGSRPMSTMQMMGGMVYAREVRPGIYELKISFPESGPYIVHVHVLLPGRPMMEMMRNHADFGPVQVGLVSQQELRAFPTILSAPALWVGIALLSSSLGMLGVHRLRNVRWVKRVAIVLMILSAPVLLSSGIGQTPLSAEPPPYKAKVEILKDSYYPEATKSYSPERVTVVLGFNNTIKWINQDISSHTITDDDGGFTSPLLNPGASWSYTFREPGTYRYHCNPHPWMKGVIEVVKST